MIPRHYLDLIEPLDNVQTMLELGNKNGTGGPGDSYKRYFEGIGIRHTSVDWNGQDGALARDLRKPLDLGRFDMVTNIGTSEHVDDQVAVWRNMVDAAGRWLVCITPKPGDWPGHGMFYPYPMFYRHLAERNGFAVEKLYTAGPDGRAFVYARLRRDLEPAPLVMPSSVLIAPAPPRR